MADYHIDNITTIEHEDYGKLIRVSASPYEDTPLGYCYVINKAKKFYYPYSQRQINLLEQYEERNDYDVNLEFLLQHALVCYTFLVLSKILQTTQASIL